LAVFFFLPLPVSRVREMGLVSVDPSYAGPVGLIEPAVLSKLEVTEGQSVKQGQVIATFDSRELREEKDKAMAKRQEQRTVAENTDLAARTLSGGEKDQMLARARQAQEEANGFDRQVQSLEKRLQAVSNLTAPRDGVVMGLPHPSEVGKQFDRNYQ